MNRDVETLTRAVVDLDEVGSIAHNRLCVIHKVPERARPGAADLADRAAAKVGVQPHRQPTLAKPGRQRGQTRRELRRVGLELPGRAPVREPHAGVEVHEFKARRCQPSADHAVGHRGDRRLTDVILEVWTAIRSGGGHGDMGWEGRGLSG